MDLFILENIIENDDIINFSKILNDKFGVDIKKDNGIQSINEELIFNNLKNIFNIEESRNYEKILLLIHNKSKFGDSNLQIDIFNYIFAYKNIKEINYCKKIYDMIFDIYKININMKSCIDSLKKNLAIISSGNYPNNVFKKFKDLIYEQCDKIQNSFKYELDMWIIYAFKNSNLPIIIELSKNTNIFKAIYNLSQENITQVFQYRNHNYQKNLKNLLKQKIPQYDFMLLIKITKALLYNDQYTLLRNLYITNELGDYKTSWYIGYIFITDLNYESLKKWVSNKSLNLKVCEWFELMDSVWKPSLDQKYHSDVYKIYNILIYYCPCKEEVFQLLNDDQQMTIIDKISIIPGAKNLFLKYKNSFNLNNSYNHNGNGWSPLLNCSRYGDFNTFQYLYGICNKLQRTFNSNTENSYFDVLSASFYNPDERIYNYILDNLENESLEYIELLKSNINSCINGIFSTYIPEKYKKKRLLKLNNFYNLYPHLNDMISRYSEATKNIYIKYMEWIFEHFEIQEISPLYIIKYIIANDVQINIIQNIIIKGYDIIKLFSFSLMKNDWFDKINQNLLLFLPELNKLSLKNQSIIMSGLMQMWLSSLFIPNKHLDKLNYYYITSLSDDFKQKIEKIDIVLKILIENGFDLKNIKINSPFNDSNGKSIINYLVSTYTTSSYYLIYFFVRKGLFLKCCNLQQIGNESNYNIKKIKPIVLVINFLNRCFLKKSIGYKKIFNKKHKPLLNDLLNHPGMKNNILRNGGMEWRKAMVDYGSNFKNKYNHPHHLDPINFAGLLKNNDLFISEKADGVKKYELSENVYPSLNVELKNIECEYIKELNIYLVFDVCNIQCSLESITNQMITPLFKNNWLRNMHPYTRFLDSKDNFTIDNLYQEREYFRTFIDYERNIKKNNSVLWYPKKIWKLDKEKIKEILKLLEKEHENCPFPSDGWIITPNKGNTVKVKPFEHLTVDLLNTNGNWTTSDKKNIDVISSNQSQGIWRCYWNNDINLWEPRELRKEKKYANNSEIESLLKFQNLYKIKIYENTDNNCIYYQKNNKNIIPQVKSFLETQSKIQDYFRKNIKGNCLDIGCGNAKYLKNSNYDYWLGIDIDLNKLSDISNQKYKNCEILHFDISENWDIDIQNQKHPNFIYQNYSKLLNAKFNCIIINFAINYCIQNNNIEYILKKINQLSEKNTILYINFLDYEKLSKNEKFEKYEKINFDKSYIKKIDNNFLEIYFDWVHINPIKEKLLSSKCIIEKLSYLNWDFSEYYKNNIINNNWKNYQQFLSYLKFTKK